MRRTFRLLAMMGALAAPFLFGNAHAQFAVSPTPIQRFVDNNGNACSGCKLFTYTAGTTTKLATYINSTGMTSNLNPVILNTRGEANVWLSNGSAYKFVLSPATDSDPPTNAIWTVDNLSVGFGSIPTTVSYVPIWNSTNGLVFASGVPTGSFFSNSGPNSVDRMGDRVIIGKQSNLYDGTSLGCLSNCTWVSDPANFTGIYRYLEEQAQLYDVSQNGLIAATFATRSSDAVGSCCSIGVATYGLNNYTAAAASTWGFYSTNTRASSSITGTTLGMEIDTANLGLRSYPSPYVLNPTGMTVNLWMAAGGETFTSGLSPNPSSAALVTVPNGSSFSRGIVMLNGSIDGSSDSAHGQKVAIELPKAHEIRWVFDGTEEYSGWVRADTATSGSGITFTDNGVLFSNKAGNPLFQVDYVGTPLNYIGLHPNSGAGVGASLYAAGTGMNLDFEIDPKGTGALKLGYLSTAAAVAANFSAARTLVIKGSDGTILYLPASLSTW